MSDTHVVHAIIARERTVTRFQESRYTLSDSQASHWHTTPLSASFRSVDAANATFCVLMWSRPTC